MICLSEKKKKEKNHIASHSTCFLNRSYRHKPDSVKHLLDHREKEREKKDVLFPNLYLTWIYLKDS